jgi:hypothetical protein
MVQKKDQVLYLLKKLTKEEKWKKIIENIY